MAPEHLEALAEGEAGRVDGRSDIYALGVLLHEALVGARPFPQPRGARSAHEMLLRAAEDRLAGAPRLRDEHPEVPEALEAVVRRCLAPGPSDRYGAAGELAADLQAVADDRPLRFAREPLPARAGRWLRGHRRAVAMAAPAVVALAVAGRYVERDLAERGRARDEFARATTRTARGTTRPATSTARWTGSRRPTAWPAAGPTSASRPRRGCRRRELYVLARQRRGARADADALFVAAEPLRFHLVSIGSDPGSASAELREALKPFFVFSPRVPRWAELPMLDDDRRKRVVDLVDELLFLWAVALDKAGGREAARGVCDRALGFAAPKGPWLALRERLSASPGAPPRPTPATTPSPTPRRCPARSGGCSASSRAAAARRSPGSRGPSTWSPTTTGANTCWPSARTAPASTTRR